jgi:hypothetical protein
MDLRKLGILAAVVMVIAATGIGTASAAWSGTEASSCDNSNYASWDTQISGTKNVQHGQSYTFGPNTFKNEYTTWLYPTLYASDDRSSSDYEQTKARVGYMGTSPDYSGTLTAPGTTGWDCVNVMHYYGLSDGDKSIQVSPWGLLDLNIT